MSLRAAPLMEHAFKNSRRELLIALIKLYRVGLKGHLLAGFVVEALPESEK